jgi:hypothetical protein
MLGLGTAKSMGMTTQWATIQSMSLTQNGLLTAMILISFLVDGENSFNDPKVQQIWEKCTSRWSKTT